MDASGSTRTNRKKEAALVKAVQAGDWSRFLLEDAAATREGFVKWWSEVYLKTPEGYLLPKAAKRVIFNACSAGQHFVVKREVQSPTVITVFKTWEAIPLAEGSREWATARLRLIRDILLAGRFQQYQSRGLAATEREIEGARCWLHVRADGVLSKYESLQQPWNYKDIEWNLDSGEWKTVIAAPSGNMAEYQEAASKATPRSESVRISVKTLQKLVNSTNQPSQTSLSQPQPRSDLGEFSTASPSTERAAHARTPEGAVRMSANSNLLEDEVTFVSSRRSNRPQTQAKHIKRSDSQLDHHEEVESIEALPEIRRPSTPQMPAPDNASDILDVSEDEPGDEEIRMEDIPLYTGDEQEGDYRDSDVFEDGPAVKKEPGMSSPTHAGYGEVKSLTNANPQADSGTNVHEGTTVDAHEVQHRGVIMRSSSGDKFDLGEWFESGGWWRATQPNMQQERDSSPRCPMESEDEHASSEISHSDQLVEYPSGAPKRSLSQGAERMEEGALPSNEGVYQPLTRQTFRNPQVPASEATTELEDNYHGQSAHHMDTEDDETDKENRTTRTGQTAAIAYNNDATTGSIDAHTTARPGHDADNGIFQGHHGLPTVRMAAAEYETLSTSMDESEDDWDKENRTATGPAFNISVDADAEMTEETGNEADDETETGTINWPSRNRAEVALQAGRVRREDYFRTHPVARSGSRQSTEDLEDYEEEDDDHFMMEG
ncbi:MAG: hypothetical protein Q9181_004698 [Wetmoreana brouardii]